MRGFMLYDSKGFICSKFGVFFPILLIYFANEYKIKLVCKNIYMKPINTIFKTCLIQQIIHENVFLKLYLNKIKRTKYKCE